MSPLFFMMVNFPPEAACTICFSIESLILLESFCAHQRDENLPSDLT